LWLEIDSEIDETHGLSVYDREWLKKARSKWIVETMKELSKSINQITTITRYDNIDYLEWYSLLVDWPIIFIIEQNIFII
jgi:hypothetical protein